MIISKANLGAVAIASDDKTIPMLNNLHVCEDGTTVAANGRAILAVSPVPQEVREGLGYMEDSGPVGDLTIAADTIKEVLKNMPKDSKFGGLLEYTDLGKAEGGVRFRLRDGMRDRSIGAKVYSRAYFDFRLAFQKAAEAESKVRAVLNRKRLRSLLEAMDKICPDSSGESPVYLEFSKEGDVVLRAEGSNGQRAMGFMKAYQGGEGTWMPPGLWEERMSNGAMEDWPFKEAPKAKRTPARRVR